MGSIELLNPRGLWLLLGLLPLVLLYVLKVRRRREVVASVWLFQEARRDLVARHPFRRLLPETSLLLQATALVLFAVAFARPCLRKDGLDGDVLAIVVDASASMGMKGASPGSDRRIDRAKAAARRAILGARPGTRTFVVVDAGAPRLLGAPESATERTLRGVDEIEPEDVEGNLAAAMALATERLRELPGKKGMLVITDGAVTNPALPSPPGVDVHVEVVGEPAENTAIVRIATSSRRSTSRAADTVEVFGVIRHFGVSSRDVHVTVTVATETSPRASRRLLVEPGKDVPVVLTFEAGPDDRGKPLYLQASPHDALEVDDVAFGLVPKAHAMPVTLATDRPHSWIARALESDEEIALQRLGTADLGRVHVDDDALVVVEHGCPSSLPGHDVLIVGPPPGPCLGVEVHAVVELPKLTSWDALDPRFRFASLDGVKLAHATPLGDGSPLGTLVRSDQGAIAIDARDGERSATMLGFDVGDTDWPLRASFVIFVRNVVELARAHRSRGGFLPLTTGGTLRVPVPKGSTEGVVTLEGDPTFTRKVSARGGFISISPIARAGIYRVSFAGETTKTVTAFANLTNVGESDPFRKDMTIDGTPRGVAETSPVVHREWTSFFAILGTLLVLADVLVLTRKRRPSTLAKRLGNAHETPS